MMRRRRKKKPPGLMLTSLLDMFTIILIFLIVSFEAENHEFKLNSDLTLPESSAQAHLKPAVNLIVNRFGVIVDDKQLVTFIDGKPSAADKSAGEIKALVDALRAIYELKYGEDRAEVGEDTEPMIVVQSDRRLDYSTLYLVLRSAANAGFFKYRLAILKS